MDDHLAISGGLLQAPLNPLKTDVSRGPPGLSGGPGPLRPHHNSTTADDVTQGLVFRRSATPSIPRRRDPSGSQFCRFCSPLLA